MGNFSGLFVRHYMGQTPTSGGDGWSGSPDIVLNAATPLSSDQVATLGTTDYDKDFGSKVLMQQHNYVYLRAKNTTGDAAKGRTWFFYTESDLVLWPGRWRADNIQVGGLDTNFQDVSADPDGVAVTQKPLLWTPPSFGPGHSGGDHYCCVLWTEYPVTNPPVSPVAGFPNFKNFNALVAFIVSHPNMGWRNTQDVIENLPTRQWSIPITGPAETGQIMIGVQCTNMPANDGGQISFTVPGLLDPVTVPIYTPNAAPTTRLIWPANTASTMNITYWQGKTVPPKDASIAPVVVLPLSQVSDRVLDMARTYTPYRVRMFHCLEPGATSLRRRPAQAAADEVAMGGNVPGIILGCTPLRFPGP